MMQGLFTESPPTAWKTTQVLQSLEKHHTGLAEGLRGFLDSVGGFENRRGVCVRISWRNRMCSGERAIWFRVAFLPVVYGLDSEAGSSVFVSPGSFLWPKWRRSHNVLLILWGCRIETSRVDFRSFQTILPRSIKKNEKFGWFQKKYMTT